MKLDHIGVVFKSLSREDRILKKLWFKPLTFQKMTHGVKVQFLDIGYGTSGPVIEIISPINKGLK